MTREDLFQAIGEMDESCLQCIENSSDDEESQGDSIHVEVGSPPILTTSQGAGYRDHEKMMP